MDFSKKLWKGLQTDKSHKYLKNSVLHLQCKFNVKQKLRKRVFFVK